MAQILHNLNKIVLGKSQSLEGDLKKFRALKKEILLMTIMIKNRLEINEC